MLYTDGVYSIRTVCRTNHIVLFQHAVQLAASFRLSSQMFISVYCLLFISKRALILSHPQLVGRRPHEECTHSPHLSPPHPRQHILQIQRSAHSPAHQLKTGGASPAGERVVPAVVALTAARVPAGPPSVRCAPPYRRCLGAELRLSTATAGDRTAGAALQQRQQRQQRRRRRPVPSRALP